MQWYISLANNIFDGQGYFSTERSGLIIRPVFPVMIVLSYLILGPSPWSAFWVVRLFCIMNPVIIYFIGKQLFGRWVGFAAGLLILSSFSLNIWSYRHLDAIWPFWIFLALLLMHRGLEKKDTFSLIAAGMCVGISFLTKEVAVLFFGLPIVLCIFIKDYRTKGHCKKILFFYVALVVCISPWLIYQKSHGGPIGFLGAAGPAVIKGIINPSGSQFIPKSITPSPHSFLGMAKKLALKVKDVTVNSLFTTAILFLVICYIVFKAYTGSRAARNLMLIALVALLVTLFLGPENVWLGFRDFYAGQRNSLSKHFMLAPVMIAAWVFLFYRGIKGDTSSRVLTLTGLCYLPIIYFMGLSNFRVGQGLFFYYLSFLALAAFIDTVITKGYELLIRLKLNYTWIKHPAILIIIAFILSGAQFFLRKNADLGGKTYFLRSNVYLWTQGYKIETYADKRRYGAHDPLMRKWMEENLPTTEPVMVSERDYITDKYVFAGQKHIILGMPINEVRRISAAEQATKDDTVILLSGILRKNERMSDVLLLTENDLLTTIKKLNIKHIIISKRRNYLSLYFDRNTSFSKIKEFAKGAIRIYRVNDVHTVGNFKPLVSTQLVRYLSALTEHNPEKIENDFEKVFEPLFGWNRTLLKDFYSVNTEMLTKKFSQEFRLVRNGKIY